MEKGRGNGTLAGLLGLGLLAGGPASMAQDSGAAGKGCADRSIPQTSASAKLRRARGLTKMP